MSCSWVKFKHSGDMKPHAYLDGDADLRGYVIEIRNKKGLHCRGLNERPQSDT